MTHKMNLFNIGVVERETGIGKDTLRVWEKRYGFPVPVRDAGEDRLYPGDQVEQLRLIKRLLDIGMRPAKVVGLALTELNALLHDTPKDIAGYSEELLALVKMIKAHQGAELRVALSRALLGQGLPDFLSKTITPLNHLVGDAWLRGEIRIFEEHLYSEQITSVLLASIATIHHASGTPRVLLTTLPGEEHTLGLLMAEATMSLCGAHCTMLGVQTPISEIVLAAKAHQADVLTLSFSSAMPAAQVKSGVEQVRKALPKSVAIWLGGAGAIRQRSMLPGVQLMGVLSDLTEAVVDWRKTIAAVNS
jgi:DNA-binding transcriptional MerR regulator/methylmalonyl-CoA mutase cobalamin-binding subunit